MSTTTSVNGAAAGTAASVPPGQAASSSAAAASAQIGGTFDTFLKLLTTQMQNQDPSSPLDTNQLTSQLVQFSIVEQQIAQNDKLQKLVDSSNAEGLYQASALVGRQIAVSSAQLPLDHGTGRIAFDLTSAQDLAVEIRDGQGKLAYAGTIGGTAGHNVWSWNGTGSNGAALPDGVYSVKLTASADPARTVPFSVLGTATAVSRDSAGTSVSLGALSVPMSAVQGVFQ